MARGGPEVTEGLSPRMRSYSRMFTFANDTERFIRVPVFVNARPRWSESCNVREDMALRNGWRKGRSSLEEEVVLMRTVGAELDMDWLSRDDDDDPFWDLSMEAPRLLLTLGDMEKRPFFGGGATAAAPGVCGFEPGL